MKERILISAFADQHPIEPPKDGVCYLWAEAWRADDYKETVEVKIAVLFDDYLECLSAAKKDENQDLYIVFEDYSEWELVSDSIYYLKDGGFVLEKETPEGMELIKEF